MKVKYIFLLMLLGAACRRPSTRLGATLTPTNPPTTPVTATKLPEIISYTDHLKAGNELVATGNEPFWSLTINPSRNSLRFRSLTGDSVSLPVPQQMDEPNGRFMYQTAPGPDQITVLFRPDSCRDTMADRLSDYRAEVSYKGKTYVGCGTSLQQVALLQDIWILKTLNGKAVQAGGPKNELPRLEIQLTEGRVTGTTGCNRLNGPVRADTHRIQFGPLMTTKMACANETNRVEGDFLEALSQPLTYHVNNGVLTLLRDNKPMMTFQKGD